MIRGEDIATEETIPISLELIASDQVQLLRNEEVVNKIFGIFNAKIMSVHIILHRARNLSSLLTSRTADATLQEIGFPPNVFI